MGPSTFYQCNSANTIIGEGGIVFGIGAANLLNPCQAKAITGGLIVGVGGVIMVAGLWIMGIGAVESLGIKSIAGQLSKSLGGVQKKVLGSSPKPTPQFGSDEAKYRSQGYSSAKRAHLRQQGKEAHAEDSYKEKKAWDMANPFPS
jgi:hypothetical protein